MNRNRIVCWPMALAWAACVAAAGAPAPAWSGRALAHRVVAGSPYAGDSAGARLAFVTDATNLVLSLGFADQAALAGHDYWLSAGEWRVDGRTQATFSRTSRAGGVQEVALALDGPPRERAHEIFLPLADRVEFRGLAVNDGARLRAAAPPPGRRVVAYGDSITQGFYASRPSRSYPFLLAEATGWDVLNMGFCGRATSPDDAAAIAAQKPDGVIVMIGVNDALAGVDLSAFTARFGEFLAGLARECPGVPVRVVTPLPVVGGKWKADGLEECRAAIRAAVAAAKAPQVGLIEGPDLLPGEEGLFADGLHPNDAGFETLARHLEKALRASGFPGP